MRPDKPQQAPPTGRWLEAGLLVVAGLVSFCGYFAVLINRYGDTSNLTKYLLGLIVAILGLHFLVRWLTPYADPIILPVSVCLNGIGLAMLYRLNQACLANHPDKPGSCTLDTKQALYTILSLVLMAVMLYVFSNYKVLRKYTYTFMVAALVLLLLPLVLDLVYGNRTNGAAIWIDLKFFTIQPGEIAKICLAIFFAGYLCAVRDQLILGGRKILGITLPRAKDLGPLLVVWAFSMLILVGEKDLGTSLLIFAFFVAMLYVATNQVSWLVIGFFAFTPAVYLAAKLFKHVQHRLDNWLYAFDPAILNAPYGGSGQLVSGLFGMADGGLLGTGWAQGSPTLTALAQSDYIYTALGEELGLAGCLAILLLYLVLAQRGFKIAVECTDNFGKLLALGLSFTIAFQVFVVVGGVTRVIPSTGLTLPFLAAGGSSLIANWLIVAMLLRISDNVRRPNRGLADVQLQTTILNNLIAKQEEKVAEKRTEREEKAQARAVTVAVPVEALSDQTQQTNLPAATPQSPDGALSDQTRKAIPVSGSPTPGGKA